MSVATKQLGMDAALAELASLAGEFGLSDIVEDVEDQAEAFVEAGKEWGKKTQEVMQRTTPNNQWTPVATGNLAASIDTDVQLPTISVGVNVAKITKPVKGAGKHSSKGKDYTEYENVGTKTGYGPDFIEAVWFEYAKAFGNQLFPGAFTIKETK